MLLTPGGYEHIRNTYENKPLSVPPSHYGDFTSVAGERVAGGVVRVRSGDIAIEPGYDGVFGTMQIWPNSDGWALSPDSEHGESNPDTLRLVRVLGATPSHLDGQAYEKETRKSRLSPPSHPAIPVVVFTATMPDNIRLNHR